MQKFAIPATEFATGYKRSPHARKGNIIAKANQGPRGHAPPILRMPGPPPESKNGWSGPSLSQSGAKPPTEDEIIVESIEEENWETVSYSKRKVPTSPHQ